MEVHMDHISVLVCCLFYLMSVLITICCFPHFSLHYVLFLVLRDFQKILWWRCTDSLCVPVPFQNSSAEWWWYQILLMVLGTTHELFHLWINTCSVKPEKTSNEKTFGNINLRVFMSFMDLFCFPKISVSNRSQSACKISYWPFKIIQLYS